MLDGVRLTSMVLPVFWEGFAWNGSRSPFVSLGYIEIQDERGPFFG
jgi:hypothetical protein